MNDLKWFFIIFVIALFFLIPFWVLNSNSTTTSTPSLDTGPVKYQPSKTWTLFIYDSPTPYSKSQISRIDGYKEQTECIEKGIQITKSEQSFECGFDCKDKGDGWGDVCDKVCGENGCKD